MKHSTSTPNFNNLLWNDLILFCQLLFFIFLRERAREGEREGEKHTFQMCPNQARTLNPGMCPDKELNSDFQFVG